MAGGAFQTSREIFDNPIWQDVIKFRIFFYVVGNAVFSEEGVRKGNIHIKRGQFLRSYRNLQGDLEYLDNRAVKQYSLSVIKKKIDQLVKENRLEIEDTELGTLFTVVNYAVYQGFEHYKNTTENGARTPREHPENGARTPREQGENNNKNVKKDKNVNNDKKDNTLKPSHPKFEICDMELAKYFFSLILENNENAKQPNFETWAKDIRLMRERDNRTEEQIKYLMDWAQKDEFWKTNILSPSKLREKFDQLVLRVKADHEKKNKQVEKSNKPMAYASLEAWAEEDEG